jgi:hypothetical protein
VEVVDVGADVGETLGGVEVPVIPRPIAKGECQSCAEVVQDIIVIVLVRSVKIGSAFVVLSFSVERKWEPAEVHRLYV